MNHAPTLDRNELFRFDNPRLKRVKRDRLICRVLLKQKDGVSKTYIFAESIK